MDYTAWSLVPPLAVLAIALFFRRMNIAFWVGIMSASYIASQGNVINAFFLMVQRLKETMCESSNLFLYGFLISIGSLIMLFTRNGTLDACASLATNNLKTKRHVETASIFFSFLLFVDDYLSILTTGHIIQPIAHRFSIARVKVAYLVHSLAGTVVILVPISSWVATITTQLSQAGIHPSRFEATHIIADPFFMYLKTIPYMLYSFLTIISVVYIVQKGISYGPMHTHEAQKEAYQPEQTSHTPFVIPFFLAILPFIILLGTMITGILYTGDFWMFGGTHSVIDAIKNNPNPFLVMCVAGSAAFLSGTLISLWYKQTNVTHIPSIIINGWNLMKDALWMVFLSSTLASMLKGDIFTGHYLAHLFIGSISLWLLPALFFIVSLMCAIATGSAWGTFSLMISLAVPMVTTLLNIPLPAHVCDVTLLFPVLGAIFSGAVCGDHISPISETTIMTSTSCKTTSFAHAYTQFPYALPALISSVIGFLCAGYYVVHNIKHAALYATAGAAICCIMMITFLHSKRDKALL